MSSDPHFKIRHVSKRFVRAGASVMALHDVTIDLSAPVVALTGPNGSGKSTLLNLLGGIESPTSGQISYADGRIPYENLRLLNRYRRFATAFIFQDLNLFADHSAEVNVAFALTRLGVPHGVALRGAWEALRDVGIDRKTAERLPGELSGGQQQRVAIARAILANRHGPAQMILADEPTSAVDSRDALAVFERLVQLTRDEDVPLVVATHDHRLAQLADEIVHLRDGCISVPDALSDVPSKPPSPGKGKLPGSKRKSGQERSAYGHQKSW